MRLLIGICLTVLLAAASEKPGRDKTKRPAMPSAGIKTPGVQIPFASLKAEAELPASAKPDWIFFSESVFVPNKLKDSVERIDAKTNKAAEPIAGLKNPCAGMASGFGSLWVPTCGDGALARLDAKTYKPVTAFAVGTPSMPGSIAVTTDSVWMLTDAKTTLSRIDPEQNQIVAELRVPAGCRSLAFGEAALWLACPAEGRVLRIDPATNLVDKRIEVSAQPESLVIGEGSIWVFCKKEGKVERIDPKTNKVTKSIEVGVTGVSGKIAIGEGSLWVTMAGFPLTRINTATEKVVQQFYGEGGGVVQTSTGAIWLSNLNEGTLWRIDPKRVSATLAE